MKRYTRDTLADVEPGWYWAKRYADDTPAAVPVWWKDHPTHGKYLRIDFGYCSEVDFYPGDPDLSYWFDAGFVLLGPIPVPDDL